MWAVGWAGRPARWPASSDAVSPSWISPSRTFAPAPPSRRVTDEVAGPGSAAAIPAHSVQRIIMGEALDAIVRAGQQNRAEGRIVMTQAVLERRAAPASAPPPRTSG